MADDPTIQWKQATHFGILSDATANAWHSGHVTEVLQLSDTDAFLVATETGGVWMVADNGTQLQLSDSWDDPDSMCLAFGPDGPRHVFAGCTRQYYGAPYESVPTVMESNAAAAIPLLDWSPVGGRLPPRAGSITRIVVITHLRRIVVACKKARDNDTGGIYWATIPPSFGPAPRPKYVWKRAIVESEPGDGYYDLALASTSDRTRRDELENAAEITIVAGGKSGGVFVGRFEGTELLMRPARQTSTGDVTVTIFSSAGATSVASCEQHPNIVYASCAMGDGRMMQVARSEDGGRTWRMCGSMLLGGLWGALLPAAGEQGNGWNNRVDVAPDDGNLVVVGWQNGPFLSLDAGQTWQQIASPHLHADQHSFLFARRTQAGERVVVVGSDGGFASVNLDQYLKQTGQPFRSDYNRTLPTLQVYGTIIRQFWGTMDASTEQPGLVIAGLQDNGNAYCRLTDPDPAWVRLDGGDGGWNVFLADGAIAHNTMGQPVHVTKLDPPPAAAIDFTVAVTQPPKPDGLTGPYAERVLRPTYRNAARQLLTAVGATGNEVYGLWVDDNDAPRYHWEQIMTLPAGVAIGSLCSFHGGTVFAGSMVDGRIFAIDTKQGTALELPVVLPKPSPSTRMKGGAITRIVAFQETEVFAIVNGATEQLEAGSSILGAGPVVPAVFSYVVRLDGLKWTNTPGIGLTGEYMYGCALVTAPGSRVPRAIFVATDDAVYISRDDGTTFQRASQGLPRRPHCSDLRFVAHKGGGANLFLGTWGRSVWVARLSPNN
jgi:hypothetical protein